MIARTMGERAIYRKARNRYHAAVRANRAALVEAVQHSELAAQVAQAKTREALTRAKPLPQSAAFRMSVGDFHICANITEAQQLMSKLAYWNRSGSRTALAGGRYRVFRVA